LFITAKQVDTYIGKEKHLAYVVNVVLKLYFGKNRKIIAGGQRRCRK
jgi:hypothetical protein